MSEWIETELKNLTVKIGSGATPRGGQEAYKTEGISLIRSQNILDFSFSTNGLAFIDDEQARQLQNVEIQEKDVLINITGDSVARVCMVPAETLPARVNQHVAILRADSKKLDPDYLLYYLLNPVIKRHLLRLSSDGATRNALTKSNLEELLISAPKDIIKQREIADKIKLLDSKITLLRQQNHTLEELAQTLFKCWFVDFEFPNENGKPYKSSGGKMIDSELGEIPEGWEIKTLNKSCRDITRGFTTTYVEFSNLKNLNQKVNKGEILETQHYKFYPEDTIVPENKYAAKFDILLNSLGEGTLGRVHYYLDEKSNIVVDQHITIIRPIIGSAYFYQYLKSYIGQYRLMNQITGSTGMLMLNVNIIREFKIPIPNESLLRQFQVHIESVYEKKSNNNKEILNHTKLRDTLLPKLMSGVIEIN